ERVKLPMTPRAKKMMMRTVEVAMRMGHDSIGTEHFLYALLENPEEVQIELLKRLGHDVEAIRERTLELLARYKDKPR
ncbi:Clp protease N-terminal domain-containing protein, partial [Nitrospira sp. BLG_2]|uniref:Clp protease N-terminal domain-containing protein n=1 Tax=Nitrospira sp. BLG_2 TaxID=3397507 RepID=UPI003B9A8124